MSSPLSKERAVKLFGTQAALAKALGITRSAVAQWLPGQPIPEIQAMRIRFVLKPEAFNGKRRA
jgi:DNA-binding transcriptional regulator YdaS (Cro superfamily)